jgi:hypothetical protein
LPCGGIDAVFGHDLCPGSRGHRARNGGGEAYEKPTPSWTRRAGEEPPTDRLGTDLLGAVDFAAYLASKSAGGRTVDLQIFSDFEEEPGRQPEHTAMAFPHDSRMRTLFVSTGGEDGGGNAYMDRLKRWCDKLGVYVRCKPDDFLIASEAQALMMR